MTTPIQDLQRPQELELIGGLLLDPSLKAHLGSLKPDDFADPAARNAFEVLLPMDDMTLTLTAEGLKKSTVRLGEGKTWPTLLAEAMDSAMGMTPARFMALSNSIRALGRKARAQRLLRTAGAMADNGIDPERAVDNVQTLLADFEARKTLEGFRSALDQGSKSYLELMADETPEPESLLGNGLLRPHQIGQLHGMDGSRKSWATLHLAVAQATGTSWFGIPTRPHPTGVGLLSLEDNLWILQKRLIAVVLTQNTSEEDLQNHLHVLLPPFFDGRLDLVNPIHQTAIISWARDHHIELLLIDHMTRAHDLPDERDLRMLSDASCAIARKTPCAILFVHHDRKPPAGSGSKTEDPAASRGDSRFAADCRLRIAMKEIGNKIRLTVEKSTGAKKPDPIWLEQTPSGALTLSQPPLSPTQRAQETREHILQVLQDAGPDGLDTKSVASKVGIAQRTAQLHLQTFFEANTVKKRGYARSTRWLISANSVDDATLDLT